MRLCDFHNHWDGVLPVNTVIRLYRENYGTSDIDGELKLMGQTSILVNKGNFNNIVGLFARLTLRIHEKYIYKTFPQRIGETKGMDKAYTKIKGEIDAYISRGVPSRGAHMYQHMMIYLTAVNWMIGGELEENETIYEKRDYDLYDTGNPKPRYSAPIKYTEILLRNLYKKIVTSGVADVQGLKAICKRGVMKYLKATKISPFDDAYVERSAFKNMWKGEKQKKLTEKWNKKTAEYLADNSRGKLGYIEMSQPGGKIPWKGQYPSEYGYELRWLDLVATHREPMGGVTAFPTKVTEQHIEEAAERVGTMKDVIGIDLAGCEGFEYEPIPTKKWIGKCLSLLGGKAKEGFKPVLRIHVGEGAGTSNKGWSYIERAPRGYVRSIPKIVLKRIQDAHGKDAGHRLARNVLAVIEKSKVQWGE